MAMRVSLLTHFEQETINQVFNKKKHNPPSQLAQFDTLCHPLEENLAESDFLLLPIGTVSQATRFTTAQILVLRGTLGYSENEAADHGKYDDLYVRDSRPCSRKDCRFLGIPVWRDLRKEAKLTPGRVHFPPSLFRFASSLLPVYPPNLTHFLHANQRQFTAKKHFGWRGGSLVSIGVVAVDWSHTCAIW